MVITACFPLLYFPLWSAGSALPRQNFSFFHHFSRDQLACSSPVSISEETAVSRGVHHSGPHYQEREGEEKGLDGHKELFVSLNINIKVFCRTTEGEGSSERIRCISCSPFTAGEFKQRVFIYKQHLHIFHLMAWGQNTMCSSAAGYLLWAGGELTPRHSLGRVLLE